MSYYGEKYYGTFYYGEELGVTVDEGSVISGDGRGPSISGRYGGVVDVRGSVFLADANNNIGEELTGFSKAQVETDVDQIVASTFTAELGEYREFTAYKTFLAPFLTVSYLSFDQFAGVDGYMSRTTLTAQMGLYSLLPAKRDFDGGSVKQSVQAWDMMWRLSQRFASIAVTLPVGTNIVTYVIGRLNALGFTRNSIRPSGATLSAEKTWRAGTSWVSILNELLDGIGYYRLRADRTGKIVSQPYRAISQVEEQFTFSTDMGDIGRKVTLDPDMEYIKNDVLVYGNNPATNDPIRARATNVDRDSATSIFGLRNADDEEPVYLTLVEDNPGIESYDAALSLAHKLLEERSSMFYRLEVEVVPWPMLDMLEPIRMNIESDTGIEIASEKWWWDHMSVGFTPTDARMKLRCNRLLPFEVEAA